MSGAFLTSLRYAPIFKVIRVETRRRPADLHQMPEASLDFRRIVNDCDHVYLGTTNRTNQRSNFINLSEKDMPKPVYRQGYRRPPHSPKMIHCYYHQRLLGSGGSTSIPQRNWRPSNASGEVLLGWLIQDAYTVVDTEFECLHERRFRADSALRNSRSTKSLITRRRKISTIGWRPAHGM